MGEGKPNDHASPARDAQGPGHVRGIRYTEASAEPRCIRCPILPVSFQPGEHDPTGKASRPSPTSSTQTDGRRSASSATATRRGTWKATGNKAISWWTIEAQQRAIEFERCGRG